MTVYHKHMTQRVPSDPHWKVNCTAYAMAMCVNDSVLGGMAGITGQLMRALSNEPTPDPTSPGLNIRQMVAVAKKLRVPLYDKSGETWQTLKNRVGSGASRALLQIDYKELGSHRCQANGDFGHAVTVVLFDGNLVRMSDPLCGVTQMYPESVVRAAAEALPVGGGIRYAVTRVVPKWET